MDQHGCCFIVTGLKCPDMKDREEHMWCIFVVFCGSRASRKSLAMSHNSSVGEKNVAVDCDCRWTGLFIRDSLHPVPSSPPDPNNAANRSDLPHPLPMFSLTPCIYNMLEQPLECKDPSKAISKHRYTRSLVHAGVRPSDITWKDLSRGRLEGNLLNWTSKGCGNCKNP